MTSPHRYRRCLTASCVVLTAVLLIIKLIMQANESAEAARAHTREHTRAHGAPPGCFILEAHDRKMPCAIVYL